jgi:hypothetical protein
MRSAWLTVFSIAAFCALAVISFTPSPACADSWAPPEEWSELSACGDYRFTATPAPHGSDEPIDPDARFFGVLERRIGEDEWKVVWRRPLVNDIAPIIAVVADSGHVVTFDNWYSTGHGENVVVAYDPDGKIVRSMELTDLVPEIYKDTLSHSVSSIIWRQDQGIEQGGQMAFVDIFAPGQGWTDKDAKPLRFRISLADGVVFPPPNEEWQAALAKARAITLERVRDRLEYNRIMRAPIAAPRDCDPARWDFYLSEVLERREPEGSEYSYVSEYVLLPDAEKDARRRFVNFKGRATDTRSSNNQVAVASPCASEMLERAARDIATRAADKVQARPFAKLTLYVAASRSEFEYVEALLAPTGARLVWLDPDRAVPQRADRMPDNDNEVAELENFRDELAAQVKADRANGL